MLAVTTARRLYDEIRNTIDYLVSADLVYYPNTISITPTRVSWHPHDRGEPLLTTRQHPTIDQYVAWATSGAYSAILFDGSLLQLTYDISDGRVSGHRLAYVPCPYDLDLTMLAEGEPLADVVELYRSTDAAMRSPVRFDYDPKSAKPGHAAVHLTMNTSECRIACVAPLHVLRFVDFVFRQFYPHLWSAHRTFFSEAPHRHIGADALSAEDQEVLHVMWNVHAVPAQVGVLRR
jgi:hypothetical protein